MKKLSVLACLFFAATLILGLTPHPVTAANLRFVSASPGGSWYPIAVGAGKIWEKAIPGLKVTHTPGGGTSNVMTIDAGEKGDIGMSFSMSVGDGFLGNPPFKQKHTNNRTFASFYPSYFTITVWKDSGIETIQALKGKRISLGTKGYTAETLASKVIKAAGLTYSDFSKTEFIGDTDAATLMKDGHLDAMSDTPSSFNDPSMVELAIMRPVRILPIPDDMFKELNKLSPGLFRAYVPKGSYKGIDNEVPVLGLRLGMIVNKDLDEKLVYQMAKALVENWEKDIVPISKSLAEMKPEELAQSMGVEMHPGALKYYKERGWIK